MSEVTRDYRAEALNDLRQFTRKRVLEEEVIKGAKRGLEKLEAVEKDFWEKATAFSLEQKEKNNKYIPDAIEDFAEDLFIGTVEILKKELNLRELIEEVLGEEKTAIGI